MSQREGVLQSDNSSSFNKVNRSLYVAHLTPQPFSSRLVASSKVRPLVSGYIIQIAAQPTAHTAPYIKKVHVGVRASIIGRNVKPTAKLANQFVAVAAPLPSERTLSGNSSLCIHGTFPSPNAYEATYISILTKMAVAAVFCGGGWDSPLFDGVEEVGVAEVDGRWIDRKLSPESSKPTIMKGIEYKRIRRRPMRSIRNKAIVVNMKFVAATLSAASVGMENPTMVNIVAEKYIREF
jgi:hypothetical protein